MSFFPGWGLPSQIFYAPVVNYLVDFTTVVFVVFIWSHEEGTSESHNLNPCGLFQ